MALFFFFLLGVYSLFIKSKRFEFFLFWIKMKVSGIDEKKVLTLYWINGGFIWKILIFMYQQMCVLVKIV